MQPLRVVVVAQRAKDLLNSAMCNLSLAVSLRMSGRRDIEFGTKLLKQICKEIRGIQLVSVTNHDRAEAMQAVNVINV